MSFTRYNFPATQAPSGVGVGVEVGVGVGVGVGDGEGDGVERGRQVVPRGFRHVKQNSQGSVWLGVGVGVAVGWGVGNGVGDGVGEGEGLGVGPGEPFVKLLYNTCIKDRLGSLESPLESQQMTPAKPLLCTILHFSTRDAGLSYVFTMCLVAS